MAFRFNWPEFDQEFYVEAKSQLETALNKGNKPSAIVDHIAVKEMNMGTKAPELEILEIGELGNDKFRGIFKLNYAGDAYIEVQTKVQANPMHAKTSDLPRHSRPGILAAHQPLVVPMVLRISDLKLRGIVVLVVSKTKGVTLVFKNDPLESIRISSTFDSISILRDFLQRQIETQLRNMLQEDLPVMIHNLSLRFIQSEEEKKRQKEQQDKLLLQQSIYSESISPKRQRAWTNASDFSSLPDLDDASTHFPMSPMSQSSLCTPIASHFDLDDTFYDNYSTVSPTTMYSHDNTKKTDFMMNQLEQNLEKLAIQNNSSDYFQYRTVPMTADNLFSHNRSMNQMGLLNKEYHPMNHILYTSQQLHKLGQQQDVLSQTELSTTLPCLSMSDAYTDDADAPWYATEGPELFSTSIVPPQSLLIEDKTTLNTADNDMAQKLSDLMTVNYTLSPLTRSISHFTFRSLPCVKKSSKFTRHKKTPKRRITRLNMSIPRL